MCRGRRAVEGCKPWYAVAWPSVFPRCFDQKGFETIGNINLAAGDKRGLGNRDVLKLSFHKIQLVGIEPEHQVDLRDGSH
jgi:hypothetical protein